LNIAYLNTSFRQEGTSGGSTHVREFIEHANRSGHKILVGKYNYHPQAQQLPDFIFHSYNALMKCDVIYVRYEGEVTKSMQLSTFPLNLLPRKPLIVWEFNALPDYLLARGFSQETVNKEISLLSKEAKISELAVCVSKPMASYVDKVLGFKKTIVVPNGSNPNHLMPGLPIPPRMTYFENQFNVAWVGSLKEPWANIEIFLEAANFIWSQNGKEICFHLIGEHPPEIAQEMPPNVFLYGGQPYNDLPHWLSAMDVGLILYKDNLNYYGSPIKFFDYLANGLAVISTEQPQVREILSTIAAQEFVLNNETSEDLIKAIHTLYFNKEKLEIYKNSVRELILTQYNWERSVNTIIKELENMVRKN